jgi:hypothetical protein
VIIAIDDAKAVSNILADRARHEAGLRVKIRVGIIGRSGFRFIDRHLIEEKGINQIRRDSVDVILSKEKLGPVRYHYLFNTFGSHILAERQSNESPILHPIDCRQEVIVELSINDASHLNITSSFLEEFIVNSLELYLKSN